MKDPGLEHLDVFNQFLLWVHSVLVKKAFSGNVSFLGKYNEIEP